MTKAVPFFLQNDTLPDKGVSIVKLILTVFEKSYFRKELSINDVKPKKEGGG